MQLQRLVDGSGDVARAVAAHRDQGPDHAEPQAELAFLARHPDRQGREDLEGFLVVRDRLDGR